MYMEREVIVMQNAPAVKKRGIKNGFEDSPTTETVVEDASASVLHTESCPEDCYRFVSRYLLKTHAEAGRSSPVGERSAADLSRAA